MKKRTGVDIIIVGVVALVFVLSLGGAAGFVNDMSSAPVFYSRDHSGVGVIVAVTGQADLDGLAAALDGVPAGVFLCGAAKRLNEDAAGRLGDLYLGCYDCGEHDAYDVGMGEYMLVGATSAYDGGKKVRWSVDADLAGDLADALFDGCIVKLDYKNAEDVKKTLNIIEKSGYNISDVRKML